MPTFTGEVVEKPEGKIVLKDAAGTRTVRTHKKSGDPLTDGPLPEVGQHVSVEYRQWKPEDGKYTMNFLEAWELTEKNSNGSSPNPQFVGRVPGVNDRWTAARWAMSCAVDILGASKSVAEYEAVAKVLLASSEDLSKDDVKETRKSEAETDW